MSGIRIGAYRVLGPLGSGGMGNVYRAVHDELKREVALKVIGDDLRGQNDQERRFIREGHLASEISHPNLVRIFDVGAEQGQLYLVMELLTGVTLTGLLTTARQLHWIPALAIMARVADALAALHAAGILHRDVKPANVMVTPAGTVKVLDLGLARSATSTAITMTGEFVGTLRYVSPEVLLGEPASPAADVWSLGCLIHELITGRPLARAESTRLLLDELLNVGVTPLRDVEDLVPKALFELEHRLVDRDPTQRPTMEEARDALLALLEDPGQTSPDEVLVDGFVTRCRGESVWGAFSPEGSGTHAVEGSPPARAASAPPAPDRTMPRQRAAATPLAIPAPAVPGIATPRATGTRAAGLPAPAPAARRIFTLTAVGALSVVALVMIAVPWTRGPGPPVETSPSAPASLAGAGSPEPGGSLPGSFGGPAPSPAVRSEPEARKILDFTSLRIVHRTAYPRLLAGGATAKKIVEELRRTSPFDVGRDPEDWITWIKIATWLDEGAHGDPPRGKAELVGGGPLQEAEMRLTHSDLSGVQNDDSAKRAGVVIRTIVNAPRLGPAWLALGRLLDMEGRAPQALAAYRVGLPLTSPDMLEHAPRFVWTGLASALHQLPGHDIEKEWAAWVQEDHSEGSWAGLFEALRHQDQALAERLLRQAANTRGSEVATAELGKILMDRKQHAAALLVWERGLRVSPRSLRIGDKIVEYHLSRGDILPCRLLRDAQLLPHELEGVVDRADPAVVPPYRPAGGGRALTIDLLDRIAAGDWEAASARLGEDARRLIYRMEGRLAVLADLYASGDAKREREVLSQLTDGMHQELWSVAAGVLTSPVGRPLFRTALERVRARGQIEEGRVEMAEALWLIRLSKIDEARKILRDLREPVARRFLSVVAAELAVAELWEGRAPLAAAAIPALATRLDTSTRLVEAVHARRYDEAWLLAWEQMQSRSGEPIWGLLAARLSCFATDPVAASHDRFVQVRIAERYMSSGVWMIRALDEVASRRKKKGGLLGGRPRISSDERVR